MTLNHDFSRRYENLPVFIYDDQVEASSYLVDNILTLLTQKESQNKKLVLGLSARPAMIPVYELFASACGRGRSFKNVVVFGINEFYPLHKDEIQSHYRFLKEYIFDVLDIPHTQIHCLDGDIPRSQVARHCADFEKKIASYGGIDVMITSGMGSNEPGSPYSSRTRLITLNTNTRISAASEFFGVDYVPNYSLTMGIQTIMESKTIYYLAWGEGESKTIHDLVEGKVNETHPSTFLQNHTQIEVIIDRAAAADLTRIATPWLTGPCVWTEELTRKAVFWLCRHLDKPILKLTARDYNDNGMSDLITERGPFSKINIDTFNSLQHTITGWPGGKPNADDSTRPERALPYPKRVIVFSPHPDDDVISMGGTVARLSQQGHILHLAYHTSGNIAVFDHEVTRFLDFLQEISPVYGLDQKKTRAIFLEAREDLNRKKPGEPDSPAIRQVKTLIRRGEAKSACEYLGIKQENVHFLEMPFYETGGVKKKPLSKEDVNIICNLLEEIKPHQIFAAGDLSDPHGTHRICYMSILEALDRLNERPWINDCRLWLYRGAWQEWDVADVDMAVPLSPEEVIIKRNAIFRHQSQKDPAMFPGNDPREFWKRAEERNHNTAVLYDKLGMAEYQAIEMFRLYRKGMKL
ncbi:MAG: PIG-L family deacetylase [Bacteroidales bacterium]|jgi:glucosamine-6-phosphate deaminase|nr:PIG-L family deacetylase [Bacteroidales bacterium]MDD2264504.1 PIG-L family deacetylase [Bacteroidales bacterium]MDD2831739.1 PIG-L family deacetylase [Bacteroidales bacterium]MDD3208966.1 PIG-L family deacetylase [Bacteroidales bacterium]MDD3697662.1 PIG-L family deacetylase [Bacteroidales bacterium]